MFYRDAEFNSCLPVVPFGEAMVEANQRRKLLASLNFMMSDELLSIVVDHYQIDGCMWVVLRLNRVYLIATISGEMWCSWYITGHRLHGSSHEHLFLFPGS